MLNGEHYFQPSQCAQGNKCLQCGLGYTEGAHVRIDSYYVEEFKAGSEVYIPGTRPFKAERDRLHIYPKEMRAPGYDPYGIFPEGWDDSYKADPLKDPETDSVITWSDIQAEKPAYVFDPATLPQDRLGDPLVDIQRQLAAEADEIPKRIKRRLLEPEDPFPPERHKGNRATVAYYDEADLVVRGNPRHARERVGIFQKLRNEYQDLKKYHTLTKGDKVVLAGCISLCGLYVAVGLINVLN